MMCQYIPSDWSVDMVGNGLKLQAPSRDDAEDVLQGCFKSLKRTAQELGAVLMITWEGNGDRPFTITPSDSPEIYSSGGSPSMPNLFGADYMRILEFLMEQRQEGNIVIITSNTTDICLHTNDLLTPARAHWTPNQFTGYNYLQSWQADMSRYEHLKESLRRDRYAPDFEYKLIRPDGALCEYQTNYYLCQDYCGDEVRIGVSRPEDYRVLAAAEVG